jgi:hypothetical protein
MGQNPHHAPTAWDGDHIYVTAEDSALAGYDFKV